MASITILGVALSSFKSITFSQDVMNVVKPKNEIEAYQNVRAVQDAHLQDINANQPGDPEKAADPLPPRHLGHMMEAGRRVEQHMPGR